jgi:hypothetical protein
MPEALMGFASQSFLPVLKFNALSGLIAPLLLAKKPKRFRLRNGLSQLALASKLYSLKRAVL